MDKLIYKHTFSIELFEHSFIEEKEDNGWFKNSWNIEFRLDVLLETIMHCAF